MVKIFKTGIEAALSYRFNMNLSVIPLYSFTKKAAVKWKPYQTELASEAQLHEWFDKDEYNIAIITGKLSGVAVIDFDDSAAFELAIERGFKPGPLGQTYQGYHAYCRYPQITVGNFQRQPELPGIDFRGDGGLAVAPPSYHKTGLLYNWIVGLDEAPLPDIPAFIMNILKKNALKKYHSRSTGTSSLHIGSTGLKMSRLMRGVNAGMRNESLARLCGHWFRRGDNRDKCQQRAIAWNQRNKPPMDETEVMRTVTSIWERHLQHRSAGRKTKSVEVVEPDKKVSSTVPLSNFVSFIRDFEKSKDQC